MLVIYHISGLSLLQVYSIIITLTQITKMFGM